ncbi:MAG: hypothetical protein KAG53_11855 [Endozoicomonadaceae bacterium]|nr:hypothetical protein [Endozoicomonadaceae bacterium]
METTIVHNTTAVPDTTDNSIDLNKTNKTSFNFSIAPTSNEEALSNTTKTDTLTHDILPDGKIRKIQKSPKSHSIHSIFSGETTQRDINRLVSENFSIFCKNYYKRTMKLEELIASDSPADELFIATINSGPMYVTDCCRYVQSYKDKFKSHGLIKNTVLSNLIKLITLTCPPMDIYKQKPFMNKLGQYHYVLAENVEATEALSALNNTFSLIDCVMAYEIAFYNIILLLVGEEKFNKTFGNNEKTPLSVNFDDAFSTPLEKYLSTDVTLLNDDYTEKLIRPSTAKEGIIYYFCNHKDYEKKHPLGAGRGFNAMVVDTKDEYPYFASFGLHGDGLKYKEICDELIKLFNLSIFDDYCLPSLSVSFSHDQEVSSFKDKIITLREFYDNGGGLFSKPSAYLAADKIKTKFEDPIHLCDQLKKIQL